MNQQLLSRRTFLAGTSLLLTGTALPGWAAADGTEPIIDIHQHTDYMGRNHADLIAHQRNMGATTTILLPAGTPAFGASTHNGTTNGLQAKCSGNEVCYTVAKQNPNAFRFGSNEVPDIEGAAQEIEKYLKRGGIVIGESKFGLDCDSAAMQQLYEVAQQYRVPILMHWQHGMFNYHIDRFHAMLKKYPKVNFIGHAQTWWANIDKNHTDQTVLYPKTKVTPGGITDRLLSEYPNMYGDMSAGSGLNSMRRDEEQASRFLERHQNKLLFGSDCTDTEGQGDKCLGAQIIASVRKLSPSKTIERKILHDNAKKLFRL